MKAGNYSRRRGEFHPSGTFCITCLQVCILVTHISPLTAFFTTELQTSLKEECPPMPATRDLSNFDSKKDSQISLKAALAITDNGIIFIDGFLV